jgi:tetratricopeptide (TPR) repeat protein
VLTGWAEDRPAEAARLLARAGEITAGELGQAEAAEALFGRALERDPHEVAALIGLGRLSRKRGELARAAQLLGEAAEATPNRLIKPVLYVEVGEIREQLEDREGALDAYLRALQVEGDHVAAIERAAALLGRARRHAELLPLYERLARREAPPETRRARQTRLGAAALAAGDTARAERAFRDALELDPLDREALSGLAEVLFGRGAYAEAAEPLDRLRAHHERALPGPEQVDLHHRLGVCALKAGRTDEARERFALACALDPSHRPSRLMQLELGVDDPRARIEAKRALLSTAARAEAVQLHLEIGDLYLDGLEDPVQAAASWEAGLRVQPDDVRLLHRCLNVLVEQKAWVAAMEVLTRLIAGEPKPETRAKYQHTAGLICLEHLGRFADAAEHLWAAVQGDPQNPRTTRALEEMLRNHKSWKELARLCQFRLQHLGQGEEARAEQLRLWTALGELYAERLNDPDSALVAHDVALKLEPTPKRRQRLATLCTSLGPRFLPRAIAEHQLLIREDKARVVSYRALKELYDETGQPDRASTCAEALGCLKPEEATPPTRAQALGLPDPKPLPPEVWSGLRHPDEDAALAALFGLLGPAVAAAQALRDRPVIDRKRLLAPDDPRPISLALRRAAQVLGVAPPSAVAGREGDGPPLQCVPDGQRVMLVLRLPRAWVESTVIPPELAFQLARAVCQLRPEYLVRSLLPEPGALSHLIEAAVALKDEADGKPPPPGSALQRTTQALRQSLPPAALNQAAGMGQALRARGEKLPLGALAWLQASDLTASRAALAVVGDLPSCARSLKQEPPSPTMLPASRRVLDLVWSSVTDELAAAWSALKGRPIPPP